MQWARYYDERVETMPPAWVRRLEEERLAEQVARCYERALFYRRKLDRVGVRPERVVTLDDLARLPLTTREELRDAQAKSPPFGDVGGVDLIDVLRIDLARGTSPRTTAVGYTAKDLAISAAVGARAFWACGVRPEDLVALSAPVPLDAASVEEAGAAVLASSSADAGELLDVLGELRPTVLLGTEPHVRSLAELARERGVEPRQLGFAKIVLTDGRAEEPESAAWGAPAAAAYGLPEIWSAFAGECEERNGLHFLGQGAVLAELVDPASGERRAIEEGAKGELVCTHLDREACGLLRFRSGELISIVGVECPCGRTGFRFRLAPPVAG